MTKKPIASSPRHIHKVERGAGPELRIVPTAFWKIVTALRSVDTEISFFMESHGTDELLVVDIHPLEQKATAAYFEIDDKAMAKYIENVSSKEDNLVRFTSILGHTHPGSSAVPSHTDWENLKDMYRIQSTINPQRGLTGDLLKRWTVMFIISRTLEVSVHLKMSIVPEDEVILSLPWRIEWEPQEGSPLLEFRKRCSELCTPMHSPRLPGFRTPSRGNPPFSSNGGGPIRKATPVKPPSNDTIREGPTIWEPVYVLGESLREGILETLDCFWDPT